MDRIKVIMDVDTGSDDAIAIMTALRSPELDVLGICTVNGNQPVSYTHLRFRQRRQENIPTKIK